jgi:hypothetical protein
MICWGVVWEACLNERILLTAVLVLGCGGCDRAPAAPSIKKFDACVEAGKKADTVDMKVLRSTCAANHQGKIRNGDGLIHGKAGPDGCKPENVYDTNPNPPKDANGFSKIDDLIIVKNKDQPRECTTFSGQFENSSRKYVVTSIVISVKNLQSNSSETHEIRLWLEPNKAAPYEVKLEKPFNKKTGDESLKEAFSWDVETVFGFTLDY